MKRMPQGKWRRVYAQYLFALLTCLSAHGAHAFDDEGQRTLKYYPSPQELQEEVNRMRRDTPVAFANAREDFDLAIRSHFTLGKQAPKVPSEKSPVPHVLPRETQLTRLATRGGMERYIGRLDGRPETRPAADFYRAHLEDYCIDDTPEVRIVLADALLNGWEDWSQWQGAKLLEPRTAFPDLHRAYALQLVRYFHIKELTGVAVQILLDPSEAEYVRRRAEAVVRRLGNNADVLDFVITHALSCTDPIVRESLIRAVPTNIAAEEARAFWVKHLESPDGRVRAFAVIEVGEAIEGVRSRTKGEDMSWDIYRKLKQIANNDSNERIRYYAAWAVRRHESKPVGTGVGKSKEPVDQQ